MITHILVFAPLAVLLVLAAGWDLASYTIPNFIPVATLASFAVFAVTSGYDLHLYEVHCLAALIALIAGFTLFAFGYIGGGDAKLFASVAAWLGLHDLMQYVVVASVFGGALTLFLLASRRWPLPAPLASRGWIVRLHEPTAGIPYGVALAAGGLAILPYTDVFRSVAG
ncbi:MAG: prepilin peptidase [Alphaproteobacteria bacterium]|nr:prepilin peptidase [Alphaproteobacteria bacterium]MBV9062618.1 prepilin peptidase [Alphaproteobacteria bacterium]